MDADLISLVLSLRPLQPAAAEHPLPTWWGRAAHALLLDVIRSADAQLAESLHDEQTLRPFTASNLMGHFPQHALDSDGLYTLRFTALQSSLAQILLNAASPSRGRLSPGAVIELDRFLFRVEAVTWNPAEHPWAGCESYSTLAAANLVSTAPPARRVTLQLASPTLFKSQDRHQPLPLPNLVFNSLLERWNAFAPLTFPEELKRYTAECMAVSRFHLESRSAPVKNGGLRLGAVGSVSYTALVFDRYWLSLAHTLSAYALYSGMGAGTSLGLGQTRRLDQAAVERPPIGSVVA